MSRTALILGITGQDGSYLTEQLLAKGYQVTGLTRSIESARVGALKEASPSAVASNGELRLHQYDATNADDLAQRILALRPDEIYNLAAQSHVGESFSKPLVTLDINARLALVVLEAARQLQDSGSPTRVYQACSSEMFGRATEWPQDETIPFCPQNPYACSKVYAFHQTVNYRETYGLFSCNGILFNHESPRRPAAYVTRKITLGVARISAGLQETLELGNLDVGRDWGFAGDYTDAMWRMLQADEPDDFVIATNRWNSLEDFLELAFGHAGLNWRDHVVQNPEFMRPAEVSRLQGDYSKARDRLGWEPTVSFDQLVEMMVDADRSRIESAASLVATGVN